MPVYTMARGDFVRTWFDTGAMGPTILYGRVIKAGPATYTVRWISGLQNRIQQGYRSVERVERESLDARTIAQIEEA